MARDAGKQRRKRKERDLEPDDESVASMPTRTGGTSDDGSSVVSSRGAKKTCRPYIINLTKNIMEEAVVNLVEDSPEDANSDRNEKEKKRRKAVEMATASELTATLNDVEDDGEDNLLLLKKMEANMLRQRDGFHVAKRQVAALHVKIVDLESKLADKMKEKKAAEDKIEELEKARPGNDELENVNDRVQHMSIDSPALRAASDAASNAAADFESDSVHGESDSSVSEGGRSSRETRMQHGSTSSSSSRRSQDNARPVAKSRPRSTRSAATSSKASLTKVASNSMPAASTSSSSLAETAGAREVATNTTRWLQRLEALKTQLATINTEIAELQKELDKTIVESYNTDKSGLLQELKEKQEKELQKVREDALKAEAAAKEAEEAAEEAKTEAQKLERQQRWASASHLAAVFFSGITILCDYNKRGSMSANHVLEHGIDYLPKEVKAALQKTEVRWKHAEKKKDAPGKIIGEIIRGCGLAPGGKAYKDLLIRKGGNVEAVHQVIASKILDALDLTDTETRETRARQIDNILNHMREDNPLLILDAPGPASSSSSS